jgi:hypothetical protein
MNSRDLEVGMAYAISAARNVLIGLEKNGIDIAKYSQIPFTFARYDGSTRWCQDFAVAHRYYRGTLGALAPMYQREDCQWGIEWPMDSLVQEDNGELFPDVEEILKKRGVVFA